MIPSEEEFRSTVFEMLEVLVAVYPESIMGISNSSTQSIKIPFEASTEDCLNLVVPMSPNEKVKAFIDSSFLPNSTVKELNSRLESVIDSEDEMSLVDITQTAFEFFTDIMQLGDCGEGGEEKSAASGRRSVRVARLLIYFHHIKSAKKKREIVDNACELDLSGFWKEGFPGIIIIEGLEESCLEFVKRIQRLRWQHMVVRGEQIEEFEGSIDEFVSLPKPIFECTSLSDLGQRCKDAGIHDLFMTTMKVYDS